eukprot:g6023.t1
MEDALPLFLEQLLSAKRRSRDLQKLRNEAESDSRKLHEKRRKRQSRRVQDLHRQFPSLQKTLQDIQDFDLTLPADLFPSGGNPSPSPNNPPQSPCLWTTYRTRGLEEFLQKKDNSDESGRKRKRDVAIKPVEVEEQGKRSRRLMNVDPEKCKSHVPIPLLQFYYEAFQALERIQSSVKVRVNLVSKRIQARVEVMTTEFYVGIDIPGSLGFLVGLDSISGTLYIKGFSKETEQRTREALRSLDKGDPGTGPVSFSKKGKLCFQWMQRLVKNVSGVHFTATDLYNKTQKVTMDSFFQTLSQFKNT